MVCIGRRSTRSTVEDDAGSSKRIRIYSYDFESNLAGRLPEYEDSDPETSGSSFSSEYSDWTAETSEGLWATIPSKRSRKGLPHSVLLNSDLNLMVPEILRPSDMRTPVVPCRAPYYPQMGDEVIYFRQGLFVCPLPPLFFSFFLFFIIFFQQIKHFSLLE